ncbi:MAG TPA: 7TM diverse intracellular signaling domain-containing protein, partial [Cytophagaceae bacterium]
NYFSEDHKGFYKTAIFFLATSTILVYLNLTIIYNLIFTFTFAYISYKSYIVYKKGYRPARFFLLGNAIIVAGSIIYLLKNSGIFEAYSNEHPGLHIFMVYIKNVIMVIDIVILSIALSDRMKFFKQTAEAAQQEAYNQLNEKKLLSEKVNRELEQKVAERTQELQTQKLLLEEANQKLKAQAEEINKMNALLDIDNWNLKKNVIQEKEARIVLKDINFEEFKQVYPNEAACYRFIEELKEENGFVCRKCGKDKYGKGANPFSRRCMSCRYDESVTAYTVFHGCKFNIQIAMYIVVMINRYGDTIPITNISKEVNLRNATCWRFAQKLLATRASKEYKQASENNKLKVLILNS